MARICTTAWYEIDSTAAAGADLLVMTGDSVRPFARPLRVQTTLARGKFRLPYRLLGARRMCMLHDWIVARKLPRLRDQIDVIHAWPLGSLHTIRMAKKLGIPVALERCNAHTRFAYEVVEKECARIGVPLPPNHEHAFNPDILRLEEAEYNETDGLLCPSDFTAKTFADYGYPKEKLVRFIYGVDEKMFFADPAPRPVRPGLKMIFVGVCAVRKGLHFALEAWLQSEACKDGQFLIAGDFIPAYREKLAPMLAHPSVQALGHRRDVPALMRDCDLFVLPSIEEGFGLVCTEAMASGCVPLVSDACTDVCRHQVNSLVHQVGDVAAITSQLNLLHRDRAVVDRLRRQGLADLPTYTWAAAGHSLLTAYRRVIALQHGQAR